MWRCGISWTWSNPSPILSPERNTFGSLYSEYGSDMTSYFAQSIVRRSSGQSEDDMVNTFACGQIGNLDLTYATSWAATIKAFYEEVKTSGGMRGCAQNGHLVKIYTVGAVAPNYPLFELPWAFDAAPTGIELPMEVALCASYSNTLATTVPRARRRGRIYLSGWSELANAEGRPQSGAYAALALSYKDYAVAFNALGTLDAGIWSRANATVYPVDTFWSDNEWDTMRSRGGKATIRSTQLLP